MDLLKWRRLAIRLGLLITVLLSSGLLAACGGSSSGGGGNSGAGIPTIESESTPEGLPLNDNNWNKMIWGQGKWG